MRICSELDVDVNGGGGEEEEERRRKKREERKKKNVQMLNFMIIASRSFLHYTSFLMLKSPSHVHHTKRESYLTRGYCSVRLFDIECEDSERGFFTFAFHQEHLDVVLRRVLPLRLNGLQYL